MLSSTLTAIIAVFAVCVFVPLALWWVRNLARVFFKFNITFLSDWLKMIFLFFWSVALILLVLIILLAANVIIIT